MKRYSFGQSFLTAHDKLDPTLILGGTTLEKGDSHIALPAPGEDLALVLEELTLDTGGILRVCELHRTSMLRLRIDLDCQGFDLRTNLWSTDLGDIEEWTSRNLEIASIPRAVVAEGFTLRTSVVAVRPVPEPGSARHAVPGGAVCTWETRIPPRNRRSQFPLQEGDVPSIWRLDIGVDDPDDLDLPARAALRLTVDSEFLRHLLGETTAPEVERASSSWLMVEASTTAVLHIVANDALRERFAEWLAQREPIEKSIDPKSVGSYLLTILRRARPGDLSTLRDRLESRPDETLATIRGNLARPLRDQRRTVRRRPTQ